MKMMGIFVGGKFEDKMNYMKILWPANNGNNR